MIPCDRAADLSTLIMASDHATEDDFVGLVAHLRESTSFYSKGFAVVCFAPEDYVLWPGGPDIRDYQIVANGNEMIVVTDEGTFSNLIQED